jgi:hypothetical protein
MRKLCSSGGFFPWTIPQPSLQPTTKPSLKTDKKMPARLSKMIAFASQLADYYNTFSTPLNTRVTPFQKYFIKHTRTRRARRVD